MEKQKLERRAILRASGLAGAGALLALGPLEAHADDNDTITGAWMIDVTPNGSPTSYRVLNLYTVGGGVAGSSTDQSPTSGSPTFGVWTRSGRRQFHITFVGFTFDPPENAGGTLKVQARATLSGDGNEISGPAKVTISARDGSLFGVVRTSFRGKRIRIEPL